MPKNPPDLGAIVFECEKYPGEDCVVRSFRGWFGVALMYVLYVPLGACVVTAFIAAGMGWIIKEKDAPPLDDAKRAALIGIWVGVTALLYVWAVFIWKAKQKRARLLAIRMHECGLFLYNYNEKRHTYEEIADIYFGTKDKLGSALLNAAALVNRHGRNIRETYRGRLTIEFVGGDIVQFQNCLSWFKEKSIDDFVARIATVRGDLFGD